MDVTRDEPMERVTIRPARADDYARIAALCTAAGLRFRGQGRDSEEAFPRQLDQFVDLYLVACEGERVIGVVLGSHDHRKGWINRLAVHPDYRRCGVAEELTRVCDAAIRACGIDIVATLVDPANSSSCSLFEKLGYRTDVPVRYYRKLSYPEA